MMKRHVTKNEIAEIFADTPNLTINEFVERLSSVLDTSIQISDAAVQGTLVQEQIVFYNQLNYIVNKTIKIFEEFSPLIQASIQEILVEKGLVEDTDENNS